MKIFNSFGYTSVGTFLGFVINFIASIILARTIGADGLGTIRLAIFVPWLVLVLSSGGIKLSNVNFIGSGKESVDNIIGYNLFFILIHTLLIIPLYVYKPLSEKALFKLKIDFCTTKHTKNTKKDLKRVLFIV